MFSITSERKPSSFFLFFTMNKKMYNCLSKSHKWNVMFCEIIVHSLVIEQNNRKCTIHVLGKLKCTRVEALRLCTGRTAHRGSRGIALPFHDPGLEGVRGQRHVLANIYLRERPGTHCTGGWVGPRAGLDRCGKSRPHRD